MRKLTLSSAVLLGVLAPAALRAQATTYADPQGRFTVQVPGDWTQTPMGDRGMVFSSRSISLLVNPFGGSETPQSLLEKLIGQMVPQWRDAQQVDHRDGQIQGQPAAWATYNGTNPHGQAGTLLLLGVQGPGMMAAVIVSAERADYAAQRRTIEAILGTLRLAGSGSPPPGSGPPATVSPNRAVIGLAARDITEDDVRQFHLTNKNGLMVTQLRPGSPAERAGLRPGDIVQALDGTAVSEATVFIRMLGTHQAGDVVELRVKRGDQVGTVRLRMEAAQ